MDRSVESKVILKDHPMRNIKALALVPGRHLELQQFSGAEADGHKDQIHKLTMARLDHGDASLHVIHGGPDAYVLEGEISGVTAPTECKPRFSRNDLERMPGFLNDLNGEEEPEVAKEYATRCLYEDQIHEDGSQWKATHESCKMCSCRR